MGNNLNSNLGSFEEMAEAAESIEVEKTAETQAETVPTAEAVKEAKTEEPPVASGNFVVVDGKEVATEPIVTTDNLKTPKTE
jgi:hypothetical protein